MSSMILSNMTPKQPSNLVIDDSTMTSLSTPTVSSFEPPESPIPGSQNHPKFMLRAQVTIEFLFTFTAILVFLTIIVGSVISQNNAAKAQFGDLEKICMAESAARAIEVALASGCNMKFDFYREDIFYSVEGGHLYVDYKGKTIEVGGVFVEDSTEPV